MTPESLSDCSLPKITHTHVMPKHEHQWAQLARVVLR